MQPMLCIGLPLRQQTAAKVLKLGPAKGDHIFTTFVKTFDLLLEPVLWPRLFHVYPAFLLYTSEWHTEETS